MNKLQSYKKRTLFLLGALAALVGTYVYGHSSDHITIQTDDLLPSKAFADIPVGFSGGGDDCGDGGGGGCF